IFKVSKQPSFAEVGQQEVYDVVNFQLQAVEALGDVDPEELAAIGGVKSVNLRHNFMFNRGDDPEATAKRNRTLYSMRVFLTKHLGLEDDGPVKALIDASVGMQCIGQVGYRPNKLNPEEQFAEISKTAPMGSIG